MGEQGRFFLSHSFQRWTRRNYFGMSFFDAYNCISEERRERTSWYWRENCEFLLARNLNKKTENWLKFSCLLLPRYALLNLFCSCLSCVYDDKTNLTSLTHFTIHMENLYIFSVKRRKFVFLASSSLHITRLVVVVVVSRFPSANNVAPLPSTSHSGSHDYGIRHIRVCCDSSNDSSLSS